MDEHPPRRSWWVRIAEALEPEENPAGVIYGTIAAGALLAAETSGRETLVRDAGGVALTLVLYWLSHAYAHSLGQRVRSDRPVASVTFTRALVHEWSIVKGSFIPLGVLLVAWLLGASASVAVTAALVSAAVLLLALETIAGWRNGGRALDVACHAAVGTVLGLGILALKVILH